MEGWRGGGGGGGGWGGGGLHTYHYTDTGLAGRASGTKGQVSYHGAPRPWRP